MEKTFLEILPLAIAATFSPSGLLFVTLILSGKERPNRNASLFLAGAAVFLIILGTVVMVTYKSAVSASGQPDRLSGILDIVFGCLVIAFITFSLVRGKKKKASTSKKTHKRPFIVMGFGFMAINTSSLIPFIAASKIITDSDLGLQDSLPLFIILVAISMLMISFPVLVSVMMPKRSEVVMGPVKSFMKKHGGTIAKVYFLLIAVYLIVHGIGEMRGR